MRKQRRPPHYDATSAKSALRLMPWALLLHLVMSCMYYGNKELLAADVVAPTLL